MLGGSVKAVGIGGRTYKCAADADVSLDPGGESVEHVPNGDGTTRRVVTIRPWKISGLELVIDHTQGDLEALQANMASNEDVPITITLAGDVTWEGEGGVSGDALELSTESTTADVELSGPGKLQQQ